MKALNSIAIDGPAGAGKSTISKEVAKRLGYTYVDTGAMYRAVGLHILRNGADPREEEQVATLMDGITLDITYDDKGVQHIILCGQDVSELIRLPQISMAASDVAVFPAVRLKLVEMQRELAERYHVVMDGRDIGSYVLPESKIKIFLSADVRDRAKRRYDELCSKGVQCNFVEILEDMKKRDYNDMNREFAPLVQSKDAIALDTTGFTLDKSIEYIYGIIRKRLLELDI